MAGYRGLCKGDFYVSVLLSLLWYLHLATAAGVCEDRHQVESDGRSWLESERVLNTNGMITAILASFCTTEVTTVQVWQPSSEPNSYELMWTKDVAPPMAAGLVRVPLAPHEQIMLSSAHRLGLTSPGGGPISIKKEFDPASPQLVFSETKGEFRPGVLYTFNDIGGPFKFVIGFCTSTGCPDLSSSTVPVPVQPPDTNTGADAGTCAQTEPNTGAAHVELHRPLPLGWVRALEARFCNTSPVSVQVYEPVSDSDGGADYRLIWQKEILPVYANGDKAVVELSQSEMFYSEEGYRLGLQSPGGQAGDTPLPIPHFFSDSYGGNLVQTTESGAVDTCSTITISDLAFPREFHVNLCTTSDCAMSDADSDNNRDVAMPTEPMCPTQPDNGTKRDSGTTAKTANTESQSAIGKAATPSTLHPHTLKVTLTLTFTLCVRSVYRHL